MEVSDAVRAVVRRVKCHPAYQSSDRVCAEIYELPDYKIQEVAPHNSFLMQSEIIGDLPCIQKLLTEDREATICLLAKVMTDWGGRTKVIVVARENRQHPIWIVRQQDVASLFERVLPAFQPWTLGRYHKNWELLLTCDAANPSVRPQSFAAAFREEVGMLAKVAHQEQNFDINFKRMKIVSRGMQFLADTACAED